MEIKRHIIRSLKTGYFGEVVEDGVSYKLCFQYDVAPVEILLRNDFEGDEEKLFEHAVNLMDSYMENHLPTKEETLKRLLMLHYWYVTEEYDGEENCVIAHGIVTGHKKIMDTTFVHTSKIRDIEIDKENGIAIIKTKNSTYTCPLEYMRFDKQDEFPSLIPEYALVKEKYMGKITEPEIEDGKVLLVFSNFSKYLFHSMYYKPIGADKKVAYESSINISSFGRDRLNIFTDDSIIDFGYFISFSSVSFFRACIPEDSAWFVENIGDMPIRVRTSVGVIQLDPGERKEVVKK